MRRTRSRILVLLTAVGLMAGLAQMFGLTAANAQTIYLNSPVCDTSNYCMNNWNGGGYGNPVKMYEHLSGTNEDFQVVQYWRMEWLLAAIVAFVAGVLLKTAATSAK